ncbi:hypothetical protein E2562_024141 [Oryza meyeriana var. granulata]|uniref:Uncharacterized protein n=1 Tax=Oryza meyeriana var. granulata TaxID=110450 RepID=A0A6G1EP76_9ORYZ|nr:hypothetical protein E2562_024141 [Oryza meyeriana var. granulata]
MHHHRPFALAKTTVNIGPLQAASTLAELRVFQKKKLPVDLDGFNGYTNTYIGFRCSNVTSSFKGDSCN